MDESTIENRVYLFESLAASFVSAAADKLASGSEAERARALRALADLAWVSCVVADSEEEEAEAVRERIRGVAGKQGPGKKTGGRRRPRSG